MQVQMMADGDVRGMCVSGGAVTGSFVVESGGQWNETQ